MGIFSCPCVVCVLVVGVSGSLWSLLKFSQAGSCWLAGRSWAVVSAALRQELDGLPSGIGGPSLTENNGLTNWQYLTWKELCGTIYTMDGGENCIMWRNATRRAKMALESVLPLYGINSLWTPKNAIQRIYINYGNTKRLELYSIQGHARNAIPI